MASSAPLYRIRCLSPEHADSHPSMVVYDDGHAHCFVCRAHLGVVPEIPESEREPVYQPTEQRADIHLPLPAEMAWAWTNELQTTFAERREWLWARGLSNKTLLRYGIGHNGVAFTIPIWGAKRGQELRGIKFRNDDLLHPENPPERKYWGIKHYSQVQLYGGWQKIRGRDVVLTEGELDALRLLQEPQRRFAVVSSTGGVNSWSADLAGAVAAARRLYLAFDQDPPGIEGARRTADYLRSRGLTVRVLHWDLTLSGKDVTDLLLRRGVDVFYDILDQAGPA